jgi:hypothetical protein
MVDDLSSAPALQAVIEARSRDPFAVLGRHSTASGFVIRTILPGAFTVTATARDEPSLQTSFVRCVAPAFRRPEPSGGTVPAAHRLGRANPGDRRPVFFRSAAGDLDV